MSLSQFSFRPALRTVLGVAVLVAGPALSQNLITNAGFDGSLANWSGSGPVYSGTDRSGSPASGSAQITSYGISIGSSTVTATHACIAIGVTAPNYGLGAWYRMSPGTCSGSQAVAVWYTPYTSANCTTGAGTGAAQYGFVQTGVWSQLLISNLALNAGSSISVGVLADCQSGVDLQQFTALFDDTFLGIGLTPVELQKFTTE